MNDIVLSLCGWREETIQETKSKMKEPERDLFCFPFLSLFHLFWSLPFILHWVIGWFLSFLKKSTFCLPKSYEWVILMMRMSYREKVCCKNAVVWKGEKQSEGEVSKQTPVHKNKCSCVLPLPFGLVTLTENSIVLGGSPQTHKLWYSSEAKTPSVFSK